MVSEILNARTCQLFPLNNFRKPIFFPIQITRPQIESKLNININYFQPEKNRRRTMWTGVGIGAALGTGIGAMIGYSMGDDPPGILSYNAGFKAGAYGILGGLTGSLIGGSVALISLKFPVNKNSKG